MNKQAALLTEHSAKESRLYLAIELSRKKWKLALSDGKGGRARIRAIEARDFQQLGGEIEAAKKHFGLEAAYEFQVWKRKMGDKRIARSGACSENVNNTGCGFNRCYSRKAWM